MRGCENTLRRHDDDSPGVDKRHLRHRGQLRKAALHEMVNDNTAEAQIRSILGPTKDAEFLQSFVRVGVGDEDDEPAPKASISKRVPASAEKTESADEDKPLRERKESVRPKKRSYRRQPKRERRRREEELYTDKDRAAAVVMGYKDIKLSLNMKDKAERSSALHLPVEADASALLALARSEMARERYRTALTFVDKVSLFSLPHHVILVPLHVILI